MGLKKSYWGTFLIAMRVGFCLELAIVVSVYAASPESHMEPGQPDWHLLQWTHEPSWHIMVAFAQIAPGFFENLGNPYMPVFAMQSSIYVFVVFYVVRHLEKRRISRL
jgi:hypothetical protein